MGVKRSTAMRYAKKLMNENKVTFLSAYIAGYDDAASGRPMQAPPQNLKDANAGFAKATAVYMMEIYKLGYNAGGEKCGRIQTVCYDSP